jgi:hypothetical protein
VWEQCICLPGEISRQAMQHLQRSCLDHGCYALNQLQCLLRVGGQTDSVLERLLLRQDELARTGPGLVLPLAKARRKIDCSGKCGQRDGLDREAEMGRLPRAGGSVGSTVAACQILSLCMQNTWESTNLNCAAVIRSASGLWLHIDYLQHNHSVVS